MRTHEQGIVHRIARLLHRIANRIDPEARWLPAPRSMADECERMRLEELAAARPYTAAELRRVDEIVREMRELGGRPTTFARKLRAVK